jgi:hypothetical protein
MRYLFILSTLVLTACAPGFQSINDPHTISGVDPIFQPYINKYIAYKGAPLNYYIPMQFTDLSGSTVGLCTRWSSGERQIQIDKQYWDGLDEGSRYEVIAHELGHCDLNRDHISTFANGRPTSVMYPYLFSLTSSTIANYMLELFNPSATATISSSLTLESDCVIDVKVNNSY